MNENVIHTFAFRGFHVTLRSRRGIADSCVKHTELARGDRERASIPHDTVTYSLTLVMKPYKISCQTHLRPAPEKPLFLASRTPLEDTKQAIEWEQGETLGGMFGH
jgi:hypothetical protein